MSIQLFVTNQMGRNVASMFYFYVSVEPLAATRGTLRVRVTPVEKHCMTAGLNFRVYGRETTDHRYEKCSM